MVIGTKEKMLLNGLGTTHLVSGKFDEALKFFFETLELHENDANQEG
jgi:Flp pilus assembly protein TadD